MRVTLKAVNEKLIDLGSKAELTKGAGYFFFRGGETEDWIDRTVAVPTIGSLTLEQWLDEYKRLKTLNNETTMKAGKQVSPRPAKTQKQRDVKPGNATLTREARTHEAPSHTHATHAALHREAPMGGTPAPGAPPSTTTHREQPLRVSASKETCAMKPKLLAELHHAHKHLVAIEEQEVRAAREGRVSDLVTLSVAASRN